MRTGRSLLARDRATFVSGATVLALSVAAWAVLLLQAQMPMAEFGAGEALTFLFAWGVMMAAMMLPSATPMISLYAGLHKNASRSAPPGIPSALFALVYLAIWLAFGISVYIASVSVASQMGLADVLPYAVAVVFIGAGAYQLTPLKRACLRVCRSPLGFLLARTRTGYGGTLRLALEHAGYCVGCCWALMVVLVAAGAMSLQWVLLIAAVVAIEKLLPGGEWTARTIGAGFVVLGITIAINPGVGMLLRPSAGM